VARNYQTVDEVLWGITAGMQKGESRNTRRGKQLAEEDLMLFTGYNMKTQKKKLPGIVTDPSQSVTIFRKLWQIVMDPSQLLTHK